MRQGSRVFLRTGLAVLPLASAWNLVSVALMAWHGGRWSYRLPLGGLSVGAANPLPRLVWSVVFLVAWYAASRRLAGRPLAWKDLAGKLVLLAVSLSLSCVAAEWAFRRFLQGSQGFNTLEKFVEYEEGGFVRPRSKHPVSLLITLSSNRKLIYELRRNMDKIFGPVRVVSNSVGMRESAEYPPVPPEGVFRIVGIGDSGMFGWDVPQGKDYLGVLETRLNDGATGSRRFEVLNFGVPGYNLQQEVELLADRAIGFNPDVVVVGWCDNDYDAPFFLYQPRDYSRWERSLVYAFLFSRESFYSLTKPDVLMYTSFRGRPIHPDITDGMGVEGVERSFVRLRELSRREGFEFLVFGPMDERAEAICAKLDLSCYNTRREVRAEDFPPEYGVHQMHPSPEGHAVLAGHLEEALRQSGLLPR